MNKLQIVGLFICALGIAMFLFGVSMFCYQGKPLTQFVSDLGKYSFEFWLPALISGGLLLLIGAVVKK